MQFMGRRVTSYTSSGCSVDPTPISSGADIRQTDSEQEDNARHRQNPEPNGGGARVGHQKCDSPGQSGQPQVRERFRPVDLFGKPTLEGSVGEHGCDDQVDLGFACILRNPSREGF